MLDGSSDWGGMKVFSICLTLWGMNSLGPGTNLAFLLSKRHLCYQTKLSIDVACQGKPPSFEFLHSPLYLNFTSGSRLEDFQPLQLSLFLEKGTINHLSQTNIITFYRINEMV